MGAGWTALDIMVLLAIGVGAAFGLMRGFLVEVFSLIAWAAGILAVKMFQAPVAVALARPIGTEGGASVLALALVFGIAFLGVRFAGRSLGQRARSSVLGPVDRALGLGFGALKGLLAATLAFLVMSLVFDTLNGRSAPRPGWMTRSRTYDLMRASSTALVDAVDAQRKR